MNFSHYSLYKSFTVDKITAFIGHWCIH